TPPVGDEAHTDPFIAPSSSNLSSHIHLSMASSTSSTSTAAGSTLPGTNSPPQTVVGPPQTPAGDAAHTNSLITHSSSSFSSHIHLR
ncbi:hypothetical protein A2U01_0028515, partial [Trifolium medium]|nr:hypothetical protein [Trifolium medium]